MIPPTQKCKKYNTGVFITAPNRAPAETHRSGFGGKRTSDRESESCRLRRDEGFVVRPDDGQHRICLVCGEAAALPNALGGAWPHTPKLRAEAHTHFMRTEENMRKNKQFSIRISAQDLETIRQKAVQAHMSQSDYVTACCLGKRIMILNGLMEVLRQQKAIGNNLNQLTVLANMGKVQFANLDTAAQEFARINTSLRELQEGGAAKSQSSIS